MRIACVLIHNFAVQVAIVGSPQLDGQPSIIGGLPFEAKTVYDASPQAIACGVKPEVPVIVLLGKEKEFIVPFSIDFLPCSVETKKRLSLITDPNALLPERRFKFTDFIL